MEGAQIIMEFSRLIISTDSVEDVSLDQVPLYWIWAVGDTDEMMSYQILAHAHRGVFNGPVNIFSHGSMYTQHTVCMQ